MPLPIKASDAGVVRELTAVADTDTTFVSFVRANRPVLLRRASRLTGSASAAEELVQDTLVQLYPQWVRVENADVPVAYVLRSLTNRYFTRRRRGAHREIVTDTVPDRPGGASIEDDLVDRDHLWSLLQTLVLRQRAALVLRYYDGLDDTEIATALGCRPGTVRSLISRGLVNLRHGPGLVNGRAERSATTATPIRRPPSRPRGATTHHLEETSCTDY